MSKSVIGKINRSYDTRIGELSINRGLMKDLQGNVVQTYSWDAVGDCNGEECVLFNQCIYQKKGKCSVQKAYLKSAIELVYSHFGNKMDQIRIYKFGMHLLPMYKMLCRLKMEELALNRLVYETKDGTPKVHPVVDQIVKLIARIEGSWKALGFEEKDVVPDLGYDPDFYDQMEAEFHTTVEKDDSVEE